MNNIIIVNEYQQGDLRDKWNDKTITTYIVLIVYFDSLIIITLII